MPALHSKRGERGSVPASRERLESCVFFECWSAEGDKKIILASLGKDLLFRASSRVTWERRTKLVFPRPSKRQRLQVVIHSP